MVRPFLVPITAAMVVALAACGGTSSETPWPVEPESRPLGPSGEVTAPPAEVPTAEPAEPEERPDGGPALRRARKPEPEP